MLIWIFFNSIRIQEPHKKLIKRRRKPNENKIIEKTFLVLQTKRFIELWKKDEMENGEEKSHDVIEKFTIEEKLVSTIVRKKSKSLKAFLLELTIKNPFSFWKFSLTWFFCRYLLCCLIPNDYLGHKLFPAVLYQVFLLSTMICIIYLTFLIFT